MFSARRSYSSRTSCSRGESSGCCGRRVLDGIGSILVGGWGGVDVMNEGFFVICALPRNREYLVIFAGARVERVRSIRSLPTSAIELVTDLGWG